MFLLYRLFYNQSLSFNSISQTVVSTQLNAHNMSAYEYNNDLTILPPMSFFNMRLLEQRWS